MSGTLAALKKNADELVLAHPDASIRTLTVWLCRRVWPAMYSNAEYNKAKWHINQARKRASGLAPGRGQRRGAAGLGRPAPVPSEADAETCADRRLGYMADD